MALPFTPSKRPFDRHPMEPSGRGKWQKTSPSVPQPNQFKILPGSVVFRLLCPSSKSGGVIGKGGGIVAKIRNDTGARIKLEESFHGCDERVVVISGPAKDSELRNERSRQDETDNNADGGEDGKDTAENDKEKGDSSISEGSKSVKVTSSAQKALFLIFERIMEGETENNVEDETKKSYSPSIRLLVLSSQVGCLMGKGGTTIKQMSTDSGALIRILSGDHVPPCASPLDEVVQITGGINSIRKALQLVSQQLFDNAPRDRDFSADNPISRSDAFNPANHHTPFNNRPPYDSSGISSFSKFHEGPIVPGKMPMPSELLVFRLLCPNDKVGSLIGKGGTIVKHLQNETGCDIKVLDTLIDTDDRIIVISGPALPGDGISPPQDAVLRVQHRIFKAVSENDSLARLLVASNQIGSLLGKGGSIINEMRRLTGANIRIVSKDQTPKGVSGNDEIVQVNGEFGAVQQALTQITARLKGNLFRDLGAVLSHPSHPAFLDPMPPFGPFMGRREQSSPRLYGGIPPFHKDALVRGHEERLAFGHGIHGPGAPLGAERGPPPGPWALQGMREGGGPMPIPDFAGAPSRRMGGFQGGNQSALSPHTTMEVVVPRALVPSIYGEDGGCLRRIREISEAKITITEPRPDANETAIIISGTPEQTHAAQSLLQAFVLSETSAP